jgi:hypothetical protein
VRLLVRSLIVDRCDVCVGVDIRYGGGPSYHWFVWTCDCGEADSHLAPLVVGEALRQVRSGDLHGLHRGPSA